MNGVVAWYLLLSEVPCIVPSEPAVSYQDAEGQVHRVEQFMFYYKSTTKGTLKADYGSLLKRIPKESIRLFDVDHLLISPLSDDNLTNLFR